MQTPQSVRRTLEIEEPTNLYVIHPIANRLTYIFRYLQVSPNVVSALGMLCGVLAGLAYFDYQDGRYAVAGFGLMLAWHVMDGADGQLARLTNSQSDVGKVLDGICDYVTFAAVYIGLAARLSQAHGVFVWFVVLVAGGCHAMQAAAYEVQRQEYEFFGYGKPPAEIPTETSSATRNAMPLMAHLLRVIHRLYERLQFVTVGSTLSFRTELICRLRSQPEHASAMRRRYRDVFAKPVRHWALLSANYRTLTIFIFATLKVAYCYFFFEVGGLSLVLVLLARLQQKRYAAFLDGLDVAVW